MARVVNEEEFKARRNQILDVAKRLIYTVGYERMSIQEILNELKMSKGAFYHYYDSKPILLEALIDSLLDEVEQLSRSILQDPNFSAIEKLRRWFMTTSRWKADQKEYMLALVHIWYTDDNAIIRQKMIMKSIKRITPIFSEVIRQGIEQGDLKTPFPDQVSEVVFYLFQGLGDKFAELMIANDKETDPEMRSERLKISRNILEAYQDALERVLGAPPDSLQLVDPESMKEWFIET
jgi:TetR/AcrR family transcriptional regulator, transcriptional repressor for nem operon